MIGWPPKHPETAGNCDQRKRHRENDQQSRPTRRLDRPSLTPALCILAPSFAAAQFFGHSRIPEIVLIKINDVETEAVLHLAFAQVMQRRLPVGVLREVVGDVFREQDVAGVASVHNPLSDIDSRSGEIRPIVYVRNLIHWPAVNSHTDLNVRTLAQSSVNFQCATHRRLQVVEK